MLERDNGLLESIQKVVESTSKFTGGVFADIEAHPGVEHHAERDVPYLEQHYKVPNGQREHIHNTLTKHGYSEVQKGRGMFGAEIPPRTLYRNREDHVASIQPMQDGRDYLSFSFRRSHD